MPTATITSNKFDIIRPPPGLPGLGEDVDVAEAWESSLTLGNTGDAGRQTSIRKDSITRVETTVINAATWKDDTSYIVLVFIICPRAVCWGIDPADTNFKLTHNTSTGGIVNRNINFSNISDQSVVHLVFKKAGDSVHGAFYANGIHRDQGVVPCGKRNNNCRSRNHHGQGGNCTRLLTQSELPANTTIGTKIIPSSSIAGMPAVVDPPSPLSNDQCVPTGKILYGNWKHNYLLLTGLGGYAPNNPVFPENGGTLSPKPRKETDQWHYARRGGSGDSGYHWNTGRTHGGMIWRYGDRARELKERSQRNLPKEMHCPWLQNSDFVDLGKMSNTSFNIETRVQCVSNGYKYFQRGDGTMAWFWIQRYKGGGNFKFG